MKTTYKNICKAILRTAKEQKRDYRDLIREWIKMFEESKVVGWSRNEFMDCMIKCKKEMKRNGIKEDY